MKKGGLMRVYLVLFDGQERYVEAPTLPAAVRAWQAAMAIEWGADYDGTEEPESITLCGEEAVIRDETGTAGDVAGGKTANQLYEEEQFGAD
jgi:hypothetical protein